MSKLKENEGCIEYHPKYVPEFPWVLIVLLGDHITYELGRYRTRCNAKRHAADTRYKIVAVDDDPAWLTEET